MGKEQYGDCLVCRFGERTVMIDAGHPSDFAGQAGYESIPEQLATILGGDPSMDALPLIDRKGTGSALNCQSLVIKFGDGEQKVLLAGDMQFASSEVDGLRAELADLRRKVVGAGPYRFVKMTHHTSDNGIDETLWEELGRPPLLAHSGGLNDTNHPDSDALA